MALTTRIAAIAASACALLLLALVAQAHIEIKQQRVTAGEAERVTFEVENEESDAKTVKLSIQLPEGVTSVSPRKVSGWRTKLKRSAGEVKQLVVAAPKGDGFGPGEQTRDFSFSMRFAAGPARALVFKALQTYDNGNVVRWIGLPGSDEPAPRLRLAAAKAPAKPDPVTPATDTAKSDSDDDGDDSFPIIAVIGGVVALGLIVLIGLRWRRRASGD